MRTQLLAAVAAASCVLCGVGRAHETEEGKGQLGKVTFANSCEPKVQKELQRAVAMLHSFWFTAGEKAFRHVLEDDPGCGIATFGIAALLMNNPLAGQGASPQAAQSAAAAIEQGRRVGAKTARERDYIEAVAAYYTDFANKPERARQAARAQAFEALAAKYPEDDEAQIFAALYVAGTQSQADQTYAAYLKAAGVLEKQFLKYPDHPGVAHYLIHSYDAPPIAAKGLDAARRYSKIAPDAPHALHMPSHIFTRVGAWEDSVTINRRSADVAKQDADGAGAFHAADYMVYAQLQLGRDQAARRVLDEFKSADGAKLAQFAGPYAAVAMPARMALERGDWAAAAQLAPQGTAFAHCEAITSFARALGAARKGDAAAAEQEAMRLETQHKALLEAKNNYWATEVEVQRVAIAAWVAKAKGQNDEALRLMRAAADMEDRNEKHIVTPGRVAPARELLGEMLLELKQPAAALKEFEQSQVREPNRLRGYVGAATAADAAGERDKARQHYAKLVDLTREADTALPDIARPARSWRAVKRIRRAGLAAALFLLLASPAFAVQSEDGDDQALLADADYAAGRAALKAGEFAAALGRYQAAARRFPDAADVHNELGFTHRKLRQMDKAFEHYKRALVLKPEHRGAHEYIGEAYLMVGDVASAEKHLAALRAICLLPCDELADLQKAITEHRAQANRR